MPNGLFFIGQTLSPLHAGVGQAMGKVDLPIEREKHTTFPCVFATGLKGALRNYCKNERILDSDDEKNKEELERIFGKEDNLSGSGGAIFTDFKILLFPVRSSKDAFKWITCDYVIDRLKRDLEFIGLEMKVDLREATLVENTEFDPKKHILLEDYMFQWENETTDCFLNLSQFPMKDIYKVDDALFKHLVNNATQIIARNVLKENKTSDNLWYEEALPPETVLYSFILPSFSNGQDITKLNVLNEKVVQIGGNETVGYGLTKLHFWPLKEQSKEEA